MRVIGAGFGRTGTLSLKAALERLGYGPCYHMMEIYDKPEHAIFWTDLPDRLDRGERVSSAGSGDVPGKRVDFERVFAPYEATVDFPACVFWRELTEAYPDAKVLLTVRDPEKWYDSAIDTIFGPPGRRLSAMRRLVPAVRLLPSMVVKVVEQRTFGGGIWDREHAISVFKRHNEEVRRAVPDEKLLVYEVKEGWEPLCEFLGVPVPDEPFPRVNEQRDFAALMRRQAVRSATSAAGRAMPVALAAAGILALSGGVALGLRRLGRR